MIIRAAQTSDADGMVKILNEIIAIGGSTAHQTPFDNERMQSHYIAPDALISCHVAAENGAILGFQSLVWPDPDHELPSGWALIASFVASQSAGRGIGQQLFQATAAAARRAGATTIDATIRADNVSGLRYYRGLGFAEFSRLSDVPLADGSRVDRIRKRFEVG